MSVRERERRQNFFFAFFSSNSKSTTKFVEGKTKDFLFFAPFLSHSRARSLCLSVSLEKRESSRRTHAMPPRRSTRSTAPAAATKRKKTAEEDDARRPSTKFVDVNEDEDAVAFSPGRLSPSTYRDRREATTTAQLAR